jgi:hypothetical protein
MRSLFILCALFALGLSVSAQDGSKPWTEWSKKDAEKVLSESPWGQSFVQEPTGPADTTVITGTGSGLRPSRQGESGDYKPSSALKYRARFLTAKPVREAFARMVVLSQPNDPKLVPALQGFIDRDFGDFLVVSFSIESEDERMTKGAMMGLGRLTAEMLKDKVYLERKDGKRATLIDYKPPSEDGLGAKIVFSKTLDGQPFLSDPADLVKFFLQLSEKQKVTMKFKASGMTYGGKLEY